MTVSAPPRNARIAAVALLALFSVICTGAPEPRFRGGDTLSVIPEKAGIQSVFRLSEAGDPSTFDPQKTSTVIEADALYDLFEGLLTVNPLKSRSWPPPHARRAAR